jgi:hypothetical protein
MDHPKKHVCAGASSVGLSMRARARKLVHGGAHVGLKKKRTERAECTQLRLILARITGFTGF